MNQQALCCKAIFLLAYKALGQFGRQYMQAYRRTHQVTAKHALCSVQRSDAYVPLCCISCNVLVHATYAVTNHSEQRSFAELVLK